MKGTQSKLKKFQSTRVSVLSLIHNKAKKFFLKSESYCSLELPPYIHFDTLISKVHILLNNKNLSDLKLKEPKVSHIDNVNYTIFNNKDGMYAWRPFELIHPALYVSLVNSITEKNNWDLIVKKFNQFSANQKIKCLSVPIISEKGQKDKAEQISHWWHEVEQKSIELSLEFEYLFETDITDCYGSIYTHSISWALHSKDLAKQNRSKRGSVGNIIDAHIQDMRHGQTNGIPQGSVLMDFIAEIVLGYADLELSNKLEGQGIDDYQILRYRDDYRIFVNNPQTGEKILKLLTETTIDLGLKLNSTKTKVSNDIIEASIKPDKLNWETKLQSAKNLQKHLLLIHSHAKEFPNSGSLSIALNSYLIKINVCKKLVENPVPLISIIADIAYRNPRTYHLCAAILSKLLSFIPDDNDKTKVIKKIIHKFTLIPNVGHMLIWLQRVTLPFNRSLEYDESICKLISGKNIQIWNLEWISSNELKNAINPKNIINKTKLDKLEPIIKPKEVELFSPNNAMGYY